MKTIVLFSGGLDSTTVLAYAIEKGYDVLPLTITYGQRHRIETSKSKLTLKKYGLEKQALNFNLDLSPYKNCSLINTDLKIPDRLEDKIPSTYVPSRNLIFLSIASGFAETLMAQKIFIGVNSVDYSGYPDCRPEFIKAMNATLSVGTKQGVEGELSIEAPLIDLSKKQIIELGISIGVDYSLTHSCYNPTEDGKSCGKCDSCRLRLEGFSQAGIEDPLDYTGKI